MFECIIFAIIVKVNKSINRINKYQLIIDLAKKNACNVWMPAVNFFEIIPYGSPKKDIGAVERGF